MNTKTCLLSLTAALALSTAAAPAAWALQTEWIATGTVYNSYDGAGVFGPAGASLDGDSFTADFYIDTSKGHEDSYLYDEVYGGSQYGINSPVSANLTINDITQAITGSDEGVAYTGVDVNNPGGETTSYVSDNIGNYLETYIYNIDGYGVGYPIAIGQVFSISANSANQATGYFLISGGADASGYLYVDNISSTGVISAAPEPAAWTLLIAGVGMAGAALRLGRRRGWAVAA